MMELVDAQNIQVDGLSTACWHSVLVLHRQQCNILIVIP